MRTLYVADLDGTLLNREGMLSEYTIQTIRRMTEEDVWFTIATARSLQAANDLIWLLGIRIPSILTNGAVMFDSVNRRYVHTTAIPMHTVRSIFAILDAYQACGFLYTMQNDLISVYHNYAYYSSAHAYHTRRIDLFDGHLAGIGQLPPEGEYKPMYIAVCGDFGPMLKVQQEISRLRGINAELYCDTYNSFYFIDVFPANTNKSHAVLQLQQFLGADEIVTFGDNYTDMQMLLSADRAYVPRNGILAARNVATDVLDYAHHDGIAHFLAHEMGWE